MTANLTPIHSVLDLLPIGMRLPARPQGQEMAPRAPQAELPRTGRLLPRSLREWLARRAARRATAATAARLWALSPHLLDDVGLLGWDGSMPNASAASAPTPSGSVAGATPPRLARAPRSLPVEGRDAPRASAHAARHPVQSVWTAPDYWLR